MKNTIKSAAEISALFQTADKVNTKTLLAFISSDTKRRDQRGRVAFIAGKKLGSAPVRSRAKRRMRAAALACDVLSPPRDLMLVARASTAQANFDDIVGDLRRVCGLLEGKKAAQKGVEQVKK